MDPSANTHTNTVPTTPNNRGSRGQTQVVFVRLDPLLQQLLKLVTRYRELLEGTRDPGMTATAITDDQDEAVIVKVIQSQIDVLEKVHQVLEQFGPPFAPSLIVLADYISLPLTAIFHIKTEAKHANVYASTTTAAATDTTERIRRWHIRRSYIRKLYLSAARTIHIYVQTCCHLHSITDPNNPLPTLSLSNPHLIKYLIALTNALPSDANEMANPPNSLDDGSELWITLLRTISGIVQVSKDSSIADAWEGTLVARLVDCSISLSASPKQDVSLQSLQTLQSLLEKSAPNKPSLWQSIFPGVFAALYRRIISIHREQSSGLSIAIECQGLSLLTDLLRVTLAPSVLANPNEERKETKSATALLQQLESMARKSHPAETAEGAAAKESGVLVGESSLGFLDQVQTRVVAPLSLLLRQSVTSLSKEVKLQVASLCQVLLVNTRECWKKTNILELSIETCFILETDPEEAVASRIATIIHDYQAQADTSDTTWMVSRILVLMDELPVLAQGSKSVEMRMHLKLLIGYLHAIVSKKGASSALAASPSMRRSLIALMDMDFDSAFTRAFATPIDDNDHQVVSEFHFRRLNADVALLSRQMLKALGKTLNVKHGAIVVDACISDFYEASLDHPPPSSFGDAYIGWLHEWIGSLVIAKEIAIGALSANKEADIESKQEKRRSRVSQSLASSILPLLVDSSLWNFPTSIRPEQSGDRLESRGIDSNRMEPVSKQAWNPRTLRGNACVAVLLLEFMTSFCELLGQQDVESLLTYILYPIVEKASQGNVAVIQRAGRRTVKAVAGSCGFPVLSDFIRRELDHLMAAMLGRLRLPGGTQAPGDGDLDTTLAVLASALWVLNVASEKMASDAVRCADMTASSSMVDLISLLVERFDHLFLRKVVSEDNVHELTLVYKASFDFFLFSFGASADATYSYQTNKGAEALGSHQPWLDLLSPFRKASLDGFQPSSPEREEPDSHSTNPETETALKNVTTAEMDFVAKLITRGCYFLSHQSLRVRISTCDSLTSGFRFLAFVACNYEDPEDEQSIIRNSILRQVASSWPSIKARLITVSDEVIESKRLLNNINSLLIVRPLTVSSSPPQDVATQRIFLAKLFTLIATMCECSGDFMADRFKNDVWSVVARHLGHIMEEQERKERLFQLEKSRSDKNKILVQEKSLEVSKPRSSAASHWTDSERLLILAILKCLSRVFRQEDCGLALSSVMASAGSMIVPFLDKDDSNDDQEIVSSAMETLKSIALVDSDVLLRPLLQLSGRGIPPCPVQTRYSHRKGTTNTPRLVETPSSTNLALKCQELLDYIESLPEQPI